MAAPKGNNYTRKWKTSAERQEVCNRFCEHLEQGLSVDCFPECNHKTIVAYCKDFPDDFPHDKIEEARRKGQKRWEEIGLQGATGDLAGFNAGSWIFNMRNRYQWSNKDAIDHTSSDGSMTPQTIDVTKLSNAALKEIASLKTSNES